MHCQKCGQQLPENSTFCAYCGAKQQQETIDVKPREADTQMNARTESITQAQMFTSVAASVVCIVLLFLKWVNIPIVGYFGGESRLSVFGVYKYIADIFRLMGSYARDNTIHVVAFLLVSIAVISMILYAVTIILTVQGSRKSRMTGAWAMALLLLVFAVLQFSTIVINNELGDYSYVYIDSVISLTEVAYIAAVVVLLSLSFVMQAAKRRVNEE